MPQSPKYPQINASRQLKSKFFPHSKLYSISLSEFIYLKLCSITLFGRTVQARILCDQRVTCQAFTCVGFWILSYNQIYPTYYQHKLINSSAMSKSQSAKDATTTEHHALSFPSIPGRLQSSPSMRPRIQQQHYQVHDPLRHNLNISQQQSPHNPQPRPPPTSPCSISKSFTFMTKLAPPHFSTFPPALNFSKPPSYNSHSSTHF